MRTQGGLGACYLLTTFTLRPAEVGLGVGTVAWDGVHSWGVEGTPGGGGCDLRWGAWLGGRGTVEGKGSWLGVEEAPGGGGQGLEWGPEISSSAALYLIFFFFFF